MIRIICVSFCKRFVFYLYCKVQKHLRPNLCAISIYKLHTFLTVTTSLFITMVKHLILLKNITAVWSFMFPTVWNCVVGPAVSDVTTKLVPFCSPQISFCRLRSRNVVIAVCCYNHMMIIINITWPVITVPLCYHTRGVQDRRQTSLSLLQRAPF